MLPVPGYHIPTCVSLYTDSSLLLKAGASGPSPRRLCLVGQRDARNESRRVEESGSLWVVSEEGLALTRTGLPLQLQSRGSRDVKRMQDTNTL